MSEISNRAWFDMGGDDAGSVVPAEHDFALWEKRVDAMVMVAQARGLFTVDGLRRALEDFGPEFFETQTYYERWVASLNRNLIEAGAYTPEELARKMDEVAARGDSYGEVSHG
mgnify:CR=1 FL=1